MDHTTQQRFQRLQQFETDLSRNQETVLLTVLLAGGLLFIAPLLSWGIDLIGLPLPVPLLWAVAAIGGAYVAFIILIGRLPLGLCVAIVVTCTFGANLPLTASVNTYPGNLGPQVWLFQLPLIALLLVLAFRGSYSLRSFTLAEYALGAVVLWSALSAVFGQPPQPDVAAYFTLYLFFVWLAFGVASRSVQSRIISLRGMVASFSTAIFGHALFAGVQFLNHGTFGLTFLGETHRSTGVNEISFGIFGDFAIGTFISGMTGGNGPLSFLLVLAIPLVIGLGFEARGWKQFSAFAAAVYMTGILRFTDKDAARASVLLSIIVFAGLWLWANRNKLESLHQVRNHFARVALYALTLALSAATVFVPSRRSGLSSAKPTEQTTSSANGGTGTASNESAPADSAPSTSGSAGSSNGNAGQSDTIPDVTEISVPYFDLSSLGIRVQQYVAGIDISIRHPIFGIGGANYPYIASKYGLPSTLGKVPFPLHNTYIALLAETGLPGFLFYALTLGLVVMSGWKLYIKRCVSNPLAIGLLSSVVGYLAVAFWIVNVRFTMLLPFWLLVGALVGKRSLATDESDSVPS